MLEALLICALALPSARFTWPRMVSYHIAPSEEERLREWLRRKGGAEEVFIHPNPQTDLLKREGWERVPIKWRDNEIWIRRKPISDKKPREAA